MAIFTTDQIAALNKACPALAGIGFGTILEALSEGILPADSIGDTEIDFGTGSGQVNASDIPMTAITETGAAVNVQTVVQALVDRLKAVADGVSGADLIGATTIAGVTGTTVQAVIEWIAARLQAVTDSASGADFVAATAIPALGAAATVQSQMEALALLNKTVPINVFRAGDLTASVNVVVGYARAAGVISVAGFTLAETGADGTDALSLEGDFQIGGVTIHTVKPALDATAADGADTFTAGTGVTVGTIDAAANIVALNDPITFVGTLTRTTPETEMADLTLWCEVAYA